MSQPGHSDDLPQPGVPRASTRDLGSPGRTVRSVREASGLSLEALATQTRLARATLEALEADDFTVLKEPVYVRGYYRKCAKVLPLDEAELIAAYDRLVGPRAPTAPTKLLLAGDRGLAGSSGGGMRWLWILIVAGLIGGIAYWLYDGHGGTARVSSSDDRRTVLSEPTAPAPSTTESREPAPAVARAESSASVATATPTPAAVEPPPARNETATPTPAPAASSPTPAARSADANAGAEAANALELAFGGTSWVRVEDGDGKVILSGVIQAGDRQTLRGKPPYSIFLGNAPGVEVSYGGRRADISAYVKPNQTARFSLP